MSDGRAYGKHPDSAVPANPEGLYHNWNSFLTEASGGKIAREYSANRTIFAQGDAADSLWYLQTGKVKLVVASQEGKEAILTVLGDEEFFGEGCLAGQLTRMTTAIALTDCTLYSIEKLVMIRLLREQH